MQKNLLSQSMLGQYIYRQERERESKWAEDEDGYSILSVEASPKKKKEFFSEEIEKTPDCFF